MAHNILAHVVEAPMRRAAALLGKHAVDAMASTTIDAIRGINERESLLHGAWTGGRDESPDGIPVDCFL